MGPVVLDTFGEQIEPASVERTAQHGGTVALELLEVDMYRFVHLVIISDPTGAQRCDR
jgi:hypothetical protein